RGPRRGAEQQGLHRAGPGRLRRSTVRNWWLAPRISQRVMATRTPWVLLACVMAGTSYAIPAIGPAAEALYTVTATVEGVPGKSVNACAFEPLPYPPIGCGGKIGRAACRESVA